MRTRFHRFLLILLMLGLPVQSFAAASMLVCASAHQAMPAQMAAADEAMAGCHESEPSPPQSHECKHCTVCALASALPIPATDSVRWSVAAPHFLPPFVVSFSGYIPDGPERPPRPPLA
ncbi:MAG: hypothetical protein ACLGG6_00470 [Gammaproteobacteria bacterium]